MRRATERSIRVVSFGLFVVVSGAAAAGRAAPEPCTAAATAGSLAEEGLRAYREAQGDADEARRARGLERAVRCYQLALGKSQVGGAKVYHPLGLAYEKLGRDAEAADAFAAFLREVPEVERLPGVTRQVSAKLEALLRKVGQLSISAPTGATLEVDGRPAGTAPLGHLLPVAPGTHVVAARAAEGPQTATVAVEAGQVVTVELGAKAPSLAAVRAQVVTQAAPMAKQDPLVAQAPVPTRVPVYKKWWLWTVVGVAVAGGTAAVVGGVLASRTTTTPMMLPPDVRDLGFALRR